MKITCEKSMCIVCRMFNRHQKSTWAEHTGRKFLLKFRGEFNQNFMHHLKIKTYINLLKKITWGGRGLTAGIKAHYPLRAHYAPERDPVTGFAHTGATRFRSSSF